MADSIGNANNIIVGAAIVKIDGVDIGYTRGGVTLRYEPEWIEVIADQAVGVVRRARSLERMFVVFTTIEASLARIREAWMLPTDKLAGDTLTLGYNNSCFVDDVAVILVGSGPSCGTRTVSLTSCVSVGNSEYNQTREEEVGFEMELEVLKQNDGTFGTIVDTG